VRILTGAISHWPVQPCLSCVRVHAVYAPVTHLHSALSVSLFLCIFTYLKYIHLYVFAYAFVLECRIACIFPHTCVSKKHSVE
jgi:hypothetical protein